MFLLPLSSHLKMQQETYFLSRLTSDPDILTTIDKEYENNTRSILIIVDEILKLDNRTFNTDGESVSLLYQCEECEAVFKTKHHLFAHTSSKHEGIVYSCNQCEYKATRQAYLKTHQ